MMARHYLLISVDIAMKKEAAITQTNRPNKTDIKLERPVYIANGKPTVDPIEDNI